jgi:hypothetical protein
VNESFGACRIRQHNSFTGRASRAGSETARGEFGILQLLSAFQTRSQGLIDQKFRFTKALANPQKIDYNCIDLVGVPALAGILERIPAKAGTPAQPNSA